MPTTPRHRRRQRRTSAVARTAVVLALAWAAACGGGDDEGEADTSPRASDDTTTTPSTTVPLTPEEEARAAYLEFVEVVERLVTRDPNPDDPALARLAVDPVLSTMRDSVTTLRAENQVWEQGDRNSHTVVDAQAEAENRVILQDCLVENDVLTDRDDGSVVLSQPLTTRTLEVAVVRQDASWVVSTIQIIDEVQGEAACAG